jgi:hypothetical protein
MAECRAEKSVRADFVPGSELVVRGNSGAIRVSAGDVTNCRVTGTVFVHAPKKRQAREIGEKVRIAAEPNDGTLIITVKKPPMPSEDHFVSVDFDIVVPQQAHVDCDTSFGRIAINGVQGDVRAATEFGRISCENVQGALELNTEFGSIVGREIRSSHVVARSEKGSIDIRCGDSCPQEMAVDASTDWGRICFKAPPHYQGALDLESDFGSVKLCTPADVRGTITYGKVSGSIGRGKGSLRLFTNLGSVTLQ